MGSVVMTGAKAIFRLAGVQVAFASNVSYNENIQLEEVNVLDKIETLEHAEVGYRVDMSTQTFRVQNQSVKQLGIMPRLEDILVSGELTAEIIDRASNSVLLLMEGVKLEARQTTVDARGLMTETWNFRGRKSSDEAN
jgi:archaellum component FlaF (FlaF/FlaG flagellin family)